MKFRSTRVGLEMSLRGGCDAAASIRCRRRRPGRAVGIALACALASLAGCAPPTDVIDTSLLPQANKDAMVQVQIVPLGAAAPGDVGTIGPIAGYGCGSTSVEATSNAVEQLQLKALRLRATAVTQVLIQPSASISCLQNSALARGIAVAPSAIPPTY